MRPFLIITTCASLVSACAGTEQPLLEVSSGGTSATGDSSGGAEATGPGGAASGTGGSMGDFALPPVGSSFQIQLSGEVEVDVDAEVFVIDFSGPSDSVFEQLKAESKYIGCYFSAGSYEPWRDDADDFSNAVRGDSLPDYPNEEWLDVTQEEVVELMSARISRAASRGCDAVYPSLVRPASAGEGFGISAVEFAVYAGRLVDAAHTAGLAALYAGASRPSGEENAYDGALVFGCIEAGTCDGWAPFADSGKAVFLVEFGDPGTATDACGGPRPYDWPVVVKEQNLSSFLAVCP